MESGIQEVPLNIVFLESLPRTGVGKFAKLALRQMYAAGDIVVDV